MNNKQLLKELSYGRLAEFVIYHTLSDEIGDVDPQYPMLRYICDRFELNTEQRYWLAFLTCASYSAPTVYYIYNEFPDYENVDVNRLKHWWFERNGRENCIFQSDRAWIRSRNQIIPMFESYRDLLGGVTQEQTFLKCQGNSPEETYDNVYKHFINVKHIGRFSMFLWQEAVYVVTEFNMYPTSMPWKDSSSRSSRNGLLFALGWDDLVRGHGFVDKSIPIADEYYDLMDEEFQNLNSVIKTLSGDIRTDVWYTETTLCAYKKWRLGEFDISRQNKSRIYRYPGCYLDRQYNEIISLERNVTTGVDWSVLWQFREETYDHKYLMEFGADNKTWSANEMKHRLSTFKEQGVLL